MDLSPLMPELMALWQVLLIDIVLAGERHDDPGRVVAVRTLADQTSELTMQLERPLAHYRPGQFAFFEFDAKEGPHPFTLVRVSADRRQLVIAVRALGDHTRQLVAEARAAGHDIRHQTSRRFECACATRW